MTDEWTAWDTNIDKYKALEKYIENMFVYLLKEVSSHTSDWVFLTLRPHMLTELHLWMETLYSLRKTPALREL